MSKAEATALPRHRAIAEQAAIGYVKLTLLARPSTGSTPGTAGGDLHTGSGIVLDRRGHILTAAHIARGKNFALRIQLRDGRTARAEVVAISPKQELALLRTRPLPGLRPLSWRADPVAKGMPLLALGSPNRTWGVATVGTVRDPDIGERLDYGRWGFDNAIEVAMQVASGNSGGPVVDSAGRLAGMVASYELGDTTKWPYRSPRITYVVPTRNIAAWLKSIGWTARQR